MTFAIVNAGYSELKASDRSGSLCFNFFIGIWKLRWKANTSWHLEKIWN